MIKLIGAYVKLYGLEIFRNRSAVFFILVFPALFMLMVGQGNHQADGGLTYIASFVVFCNYAVQTVSLQAMGMRIAESRHADWTLFVKCLPSSVLVQICGRIIAMLILALLSLLIMIVAANEFFHVALTCRQVLWIAMVALAGGVPMGLLAIAIGYRVNPVAARSVFVIVNLGLVFAGYALPSAGFVGEIRQFVPTYQWMLLGLSYIKPDISVVMPALNMLGFTVISFVLAVWSYRCQKDIRAA